jgi:hypothetical protein
MVTQDSVLKSSTNPALTEYLHLTFENVTKHFFTCDETPQPQGYGPGIYHCDVRSPSSSGQTLNLNFCQFDVSSFCVCLSYLFFQTPDPLEGDYLTIHPNPTGISKYYGPSLKAADVPPK